MLLKTAFKNLKKNPVMNIICLIQLTAVFLIAAVMVSSMSVRLRTYTPLKDILDERGLWAQYHPNLFGALKPGGDPNTDALFSVDDLNGYMNADKIFTIRTQSIFDSDFSKTARALFYDGELLGRYSPGLKRGRWLSPDADELEIVITDGIFDLDIGDEAELFIGQYHQQRIPVKVKVVGVLEDDASILGEMNARNKTGDTYRFLYRQANDLLNSVILVSMDTMTKLYPNAYELYIYSVFFQYDDISDETLSDMKRKAGEMNAHIALSLEDINRNSKEYLRAELMKQLPIAVILLVLTTVSSISVSAISTRRRLKDYAKYYVLGLQWRQCALVNFFQALTVGAAALLIACAGLLIVGVTSLSDTFMIIWNAPMILTLLAITAMYLGFSMIMPLLMLRSTTPKALLQTK